MIQTIFQYVMVFVLVFFYAHLYLHFLVNPNNQCSIVSNLTKEEVTDHVYQKQPFLLDATSFRKDCRKILSTLKPVSETSVESSSLSYEPIPILEPYVRFYSDRKRMHFLKKKKWLETTESCRTFYHVYKGTFHVTCIHPHKKEDIPKKTKDYKLLKKNVDLLQLTLHEDSMLFLPKDWILYIESLEKDSMLEKIQYYTPLNLLANSIFEIYKYLSGSIYICSTKERPFIL